MSADATKQVRVGVSVFVQHPKSALHSKPVFVLGLRKGSHGAGTWGLPGGHLEHGESFEECAKREVWEETGFTLTNVYYLTATNDVFPMQDHAKHYITIFMIGQVETDSNQEQECQHEELQAAVKEPQKCERWEWFSWDEITAWAKNELQNGDTNSFSHRPFLPLINLVQQRPGFQPLACPKEGWH